MTVTYSNLLRLADLATGTEVGTWGDLTDTNICTLLAQAVTGVSYIPVAADNTSDQIVTALNGALDQARSAVLSFTGTLSVTKAMIIPNSVKLYHVFNSTTGGGTIVVKPAAASNTVSIPQGVADIVYCDGTNTYSMLAGKLARYLPLTGGAISGQLVVQNGGLVVNATSGAGNSSVYIQSFYGNNANLYFGNTHGVRWLLTCDTNPETGGNSGSNFIIGPLSDAGAYIGNAITVLRSNMGVTFSGPVQCNSSLGIAGAFTTSGAITSASLHTTGSIQADVDVNVSRNVSVAGFVNAIDNISTAAAVFANNVIASGSTYAAGGHWVGGNGDRSFGMYSDGGNLFITQYLPLWTWQFDHTNGNLTWTRPISPTAGTGFFVCRATDNFVYNSLGAMGGNGAYNNFSDRSLKENIAPWQGSLGAVRKLLPKSFTRKGGSEQEVGFIAQDVQPVLPEAVRSVERDGTMILALTYEAIVATLVNAVQELTDRVVTLESRA